MERARAFLGDGGVGVDWVDGWVCVGWVGGWWGGWVGLVEWVSGWVGFGGGWMELRCCFSFSYLEDGGTDTLAVPQGKGLADQTVCVCI